MDTIHFITFMMTGFGLATLFQILQKHEKLTPFFNVIFFLSLFILSALAWIFSFSMGGWVGMSMGNIALSTLVAALSGLLSSFALNLLKFK
ncbi:hypothetical protein HF072_06235 [Bacillus sp. RO3]|nr:hypothetical protein [Bacillus sp. RO3]